MTVSLRNTLASNEVYKRDRYKLLIEGSVVLEHTYSIPDPMRAGARMVYRSGRPKMEGRLFPDETH